MKNKFLLALISASLLLSGCVETKNETDNTKTITTREGFIHDLDYETRENDNGETENTVIGVKDVQIFESLSDDGYKHYPIVILTIDLSDFDEESLYWFYEDYNKSSFPNKLLDTTCYYKSPKNEINSIEPLSKILTYRDDEAKELVFVFTEFDEALRYSIEDIELDVILKINNEKSVDNEKEYWINVVNDKNTTPDFEEGSITQYSVTTIHISRPIRDKSEMTEEQQELYQKGLEKTYQNELSNLNYFLSK